MKYYVIPETQDDCDLPTQPNAIQLDEVSGEIIRFLARYCQQGHYTNCRQQRLSLDELSFRVVPETEI